MKKEFKYKKKGADAPLLLHVRFGALAVQADDSIQP